MAEPTREIDDAMVERAARAMFEVPDGLGPGDYSWDDTVREDQGRADLWRADARAVLTAALSQPTPSAEHVEDWTDAQNNEGPACSCGFNGSFAECAAWRAENPAPPSIVDMAPGTTFTRPSTRWTVVAPGSFSGRAMVADPDGVTHYLDDIDPSTIRDVTPPKETP